MRTDEYFAGLFDGEGCVLIRKLRRYQSKAEIYDYSIQAGVAMCDLRPIKELKKAYKGSTCPVRSYGPPGTSNFVHIKPVWRWTVVSRDAEAFLRSIYPFALVKHEEIRLALRFQAHLDRVRHGYRVKNKKGYHGYPEWILKYREGIYRRLQVLKKRQFHA